MTTTLTTAGSPTEVMQLFATRAAVGDLDGLMELYESDAVFQPQFGTALEGIDQIRAASAEFMALRPQISYDQAPDVLIAGDIALVTNFWTMTATAPDGSTIREGGTSADVVHRGDDGMWRVLIDQPRGVPVT